jgi:hypothetical protein
MHWTEAVAVIIIVAALIPVFILLFYIGAIAWGGLAYWRESRRVGVGREHVCEQGVFTRKIHGWSGKIQDNDRHFQIDVRDEEGLPEPGFLNRLPGIFLRLAELERAARKEVVEITEEYVLDSILSPVRMDDDYEFALGFSNDDEEDYCMSIYVNFKEDQVVGWLEVD